jgi:sulfate/thiosulfate-binding protein
LRAGLEADVVPLNQITDLDALVEAKLVGKDWQTKYPYKASPYRSIMTFIVRHGNPKGIKNWDDLVKAGMQIALANPKTSGNGRYAYLSAYGYALKAAGGDEAAALEFMKKLYANVPVMDTGGRGATRPLPPEKLSGQSSTTAALSTGFMFDSKPQGHLKA